jgi:RNA polymerase sigma-70 factor (ECF subfamily)
MAAAGRGCGRESFATTQWTTVLAAGHGDAPAARAALERLCGRYWYPLYAYVRRRGYAPADAEDLTQGFFERLLRLQSLAEVAPERGRFR